MTFYVSDLWNFTGCIFFVLWFSNFLYPVACNYSSTSVFGLYFNKLSASMVLSDRIAYLRGYWVTCFFVLERNTEPTSEKPLLV